ncbi:hypothetical protein HMPREF9069_00580 [Atopobium sp. oral taxon 810 str. F0209]|nr:hypothetical protein HMPREF9069_00580 [Atopobium sp. oral taxon 810 str. F0209]
MVLPGPFFVACHVSGQIGIRENVVSTCFHATPSAKRHKLFQLTSLRLPKTTHSFKQRSSAYQVLIIPMRKGFLIHHLV